MITGLGWHPIQDDPYLFYLASTCRVYSGSSVDRWYSQDHLNLAAALATETTEANMPQLNSSNADFGGRPTITTTGTQRLKTGTLSLAGSLTIYVVTRYNAANNSFMLESWNSGRVAILVYNGYLSVVRDGTILNTGYAPADNELIIFAAVLNGAKSAIYVNNRLVWTGNCPTQNDTAAGMHLGCQNGTGPWGRPIGHISVYKAGHSAAQVARHTRFWSRWFKIPVPDSNPIDLSDIRYVYDASAGVELDGSNNVAIWTPTKAPDATYVAAQSTAGERPATIVEEGNTGIYFAAGKTLRTPTFSSALTQPSTHYLVAKYLGTANPYAIVVDGIGASNRNTLYLYNNGVSIFSGVELRNGTNGVGVRAVTSAEFNGANSAARYKDRNYALTTGNAGTNSLTGLLFGEATGDSSNESTANAYLFYYCAGPGSHSATVRDYVLTALSSRFQAIMF